LVLGGGERIGIETLAGREGVLTVCEVVQGDLTLLDPTGQGGPALAQG
jgi:hypothetical protein